MKKLLYFAIAIALGSNCVTAADYNINSFEDIQKYLPFDVESNLTINGNLTLTENMPSIGVEILKIQGNNPNIIIDGQEFVGFNTTTNETQSSVYKNITLKNFNQAISIYNGKFIADGVTFENNKHYERGSALHIEVSQNTAEIKNSTFKNNMITDFKRPSSDGMGGAIFCIAKDLIIENSTFENNGIDVKSGALGGVIFGEEDGDDNHTIIQNSYFSNNFAKGTYMAVGGAIML